MIHIDELREIVQRWDAGMWAWNRTTPGDWEGATDTQGREITKPSRLQTDTNWKETVHENDNMRKIFDGLMAILPPEYFVKEDGDG